MEYKVHRDDHYFVKLRYPAALDFANYFIKHGIPVMYTCRPKGEGWREISFADDTENVDVMLAWIETYDKGHKRCPFCDGIGDIYVCDDDMHVRCTKCGAMTKATSRHHSEEYIWTYWNERARKE